MVQSGNWTLFFRVKGTGGFFRLGLTMLLVLALAGCNNYNLSLEDFFGSGAGKSGGEITALSISGIWGAINKAARTVTVTVPTDTPLTSLAPIIAHSGTGIVPASGVAQNFYAAGFTPVTYTVTGTDGSAAVWTVVVRMQPLDIPMAGIDVYISTYPTTPVPLPLAVDLSGPGWTDLLNEIDAGSKQVALDLSACTMGGGTVFDPGSANTGKNQIVSLNLPDAAASVAAGTSSYPTFRFFSALKTLAGANVTDIGNFAFFNCSALTTVSLPSAASIGTYAFYNCYTLATVSLPAATSIGGAAFSICTSLAAVSLPAATDIGNNAFSGTGTGGLTVTLGAAAPMLGMNMFNSVSSKTVTVRVPGTATGYTYTNDADTVTHNWGNGFRGGGWNGGAMTGGTVNSGISLAIAYVP
jgi:hypothetical protein